MYATDLSGKSIILSDVNTSAYDMYSMQMSETLNIDGVNYTYQYHYKNGNRAVTITNDLNDNIDEIVYDASSSNIYLNDEICGSIANNDEQLEEDTPSARAFYEWETCSSSTEKISWAKGTTTAIVAGCIAIYLGTLGTAGVIAAMGPSALSILAASSVGGTLYVKLQSFIAPAAGTQYRYLWSFKASTGDLYGTYISHVNM